MTGEAHSRIGRRRLLAALEGLIMEPAEPLDWAGGAGGTGAWRRDDGDRIDSGPLILSTELAGAGGGLAAAAGVAVAIAEPPATALLVELGGARGRRPTTLASHAAGEVETRLRDRGFAACARGRLCWLSLEGGEDGLLRLAAARDLAPPAPVIAHLPARTWPQALAQHGDDAGAALLRADTAADRPLVALAVSELRERGLRARVATQPLGRVGSRRALAGLEPGGAASERGRRLARGLLGPRSSSSRTGAESGQVLPLMLGAAFVVLLCALLLAVFGGVFTGAGRV